jgi:spermidine synthase
MYPGHGPKTFDEIRLDTESIVMEKKPEGCTGKIVFMTDNQNPSGPGSTRKTLFKDQEALVEDVLDTEGEVTRRLYFAKNYYRRQAQVVLSYKDGHGDCEWGLLKPQAGKVATRNGCMLDFAYNRALYLAWTLFGRAGSSSGALLGLGSGILGDFIKQYNPEAGFVEVEKSQLVIELARKYFFHGRDAVHQDALQFVKEAKEGSLDFIILDIDASEPGQSVPPKEFGQKEFLKDCYKALSSKGVLVINSIVKTGDSSKELKEELKELFPGNVTLQSLTEVYTVCVGVKGVADRKQMEEQVANGLVALRKAFGSEDYEENEFEDIAKSCCIVSPAKAN